MLCSKRNKKGYHEIPISWKIQADHLARDINDHVFSDGLVWAYPAVKGGWKAGYKWRGRFNVTVQAYNQQFKFYQKGTRLETYPDGRTYGYSIEDSRKAIDKHRPEMDRWKLWRRVLEIYRRSGLIPKHIAVKHNAVIKELDYGTPPQMPVLQILFTMMMRYILRHGVCPKCKAKDFQETIYGIECKNCKSYYDDTMEFKWKGGK